MDLQYAYGYDDPAGSGRVLVTYKDTDAYGGVTVVLTLKSRAESKLQTVAVQMEGDAEVTSTLLRELPLARLLDQYRLSMEVSELSFMGRDGETMTTSRAGRGYDEAYYAEFAASYLRLVAAGERRPADVMAERLPGIQSPRTVHSRLAKARKLGLLTSPEKGAAGGELTPRALELLAPNEQLQAAIDDAKAKIRAKADNEHA